MESSQHTITGNRIIFALLIIMEMQGPSQLCTWPCPGKQDETSGLGTHTDLGPLPCPRGGVQRGQRRGVSLPWGWGALPAPPTVCHQSHFRSCGLISQEFAAQIPQEENVSKVRRGKCPSACASLTPPAAVPRFPGPPCLLSRSPCMEVPGPAAFGPSKVLRARMTFRAHLGWPFL